MVGICTTLIGLVKSSMGGDRLPSCGGCRRACGLAVLVSALASYLAIRLSSQGRVSAWCERIADLFFVAGLVSLTLKWTPEMGPVGSLETGPFPSW